MHGSEFRKQRLAASLSQSKLADLTDIKSSKISAFELGKISLEYNEINTLIKALKSYDPSCLQKKRYHNKISGPSIIDSNPRRSYSVTQRNSDYLLELEELNERFDNAKSNLKAISFFAGGGGLCYGLKAAGFDIIATNELIKEYREIYSLNFQNCEFLSDNIKDITETDVDRFVGKIDLMVGGPPCQGFSLAGKRDTKDSRNNLFKYYINLAKVIRPKVILMENVKLLTSMKDEKGELILLKIISSLKKIGYRCDYYIINAKDYGVPQHRERVFFLGIREDLNLKPSILAPTHGDNNGSSNLAPYFTFGDAVSDLDYIESGESSPHDTFHKSVKHPEHVLRWLFNVPEGKSAHDNPPHLRPPSGYNTTYKRQVWGEVGSTVTTTFSMISGCRNVHPIATRSLTIREAMRLQSFPDSYRLVGNLGSIRAIIGNAVPPLLAYKLANFIKKSYIL